MARTLIYPCMQCAIDPGDRMLGQGDDTPFGHGQQLCEIFVKSNITVRNCHRTTCISFGKYALQPWPWRYDLRTRL